MKKLRRRYIVEVDVDGVPGWNDRSRPEDMTRDIQRLLDESVGHYNPTVVYVDEVEE